MTQTSIQNIIGIDLGTTNCVVAVLGSDLKPRTIPSIDGAVLVPSVINLRDEKNPVVGRAAVSQAALAGEYTIAHVKRSVGLTDGSGKPLPIFVHPDSGQNYTAIDLSSILLGYLARGAEAHLGGPVGGAVITVPAYFDHEAREATKLAGTKAGLNVIQIVNEPTAAGLAFGLEKAAEGIYAVDDLGGGTFDVSILEIRNGNIVVKATDGDRNLGGSDIDNILLQNALAAFKAEHGFEITPESDLPSYIDAREKCETAKKNLSQALTTSFVVASEGKRLIIEISRAEFESMIAEIVDRTQTITLRALKAAGVEPRQIRDVLLVGGSTRIPKVREMLTSVFGKAPRTDTHPDEAVALGAAILGPIRAAETGVRTLDGEGKPVLPPAATVVDVTSHSLGCLAVSNGVERNVVIIPVNTQLPAERKDMFGLTSPMQTSATVAITSGPDGAPEPACKTHGKLVLTGIPPREVGKLSIEVTYAFTIDGTLAVTIKDLISGKSTHDLVRIDPSN